MNDDKVTVADLEDLMNATEFLWLINRYSDDYVSGLQSLEAEPIRLTTPLDFKGFLATVEKPRHLKISGTDERATVDLFVNGRLREKNILRHIPTQRILESYIYGQVHFDAMDGGETDPFTSSRESIVEDDKNFQSLLDCLKNQVLPQVLDKWDELRLGRGKEGDEENARKSKKERKARDLYSAAKEEYRLDRDAPQRDRVEQWLNGLRDDAEFNLAAYADCFLSENLLRKFILEHKIQIVPKSGASNEIVVWKDRETKRKNDANISFDIRREGEDLSYLGMDYLASVAEGPDAQSKNPSLWKDAVAYKPVRNAVGHTGLLTKTAKSHLNVIYENIKARVKDLVSEKEREK